MPLSQPQKLKVIPWCHGTTHIPISLRVSVCLLPRGLWESGFPEDRYTAWLRILPVSFNLELPPLFLCGWLYEDQSGLCAVETSIPEFISLLLLCIFELAIPGLYFP